MKLHYLGHSCFLAEFSKTRALIDPYFADASAHPEFKPLIKSPMLKESLPQVSAILVTHEHFDHFDKSAVEYLARRDNAVVVSHENTLNELSVPQGLLRPMLGGGKAEFRGLEIEALPAHHPNSFYPLSFILHADNQSLFHAGDTDLTDSFAEIKADVALLPIGGTYTMDLIDAVKAAKTIKPAVAIPMHYNTFDSIMADPNEFQRRIEKSILRTKAVVLEPGGTYVHK